MSYKIFGREPALYIQTIVAILIMAATFGLPISDGLTAAIEAVLTAVAALVIALRVTPVAPTVFTGVITTGAVLVGYFGLHLSQATVAAVVTAAGMAVTLISRSQQTPVAGATPTQLREVGA